MSEYLDPMELDVRHSVIQREGEKEGAGKERRILNSGRKKGLYGKSLCGSRERQCIEPRRTVSKLRKMP